MNSGRLGPGTVRLGWEAVSGRGGLGPTLVIRGTVVADGNFRPGDAILVMVELSAWQLARTSNAYVGSCTPLPVVIGHPTPNYAPSILQQIGEGFTSAVEVKCRLDSTQIAELEDRRQGRPFQLQADTTVLFLGAGGVAAGQGWSSHPMVSWQETINVTEESWGQVLAQWEMGATVPVSVALPEVVRGPQRAEIVRLLREGLHRVNDGQYEAAFLAGRKATEMLRAMCKPSGPRPVSPKDRDVAQRTYDVVDALFGLASAPVHADGATSGFQPSRSEALAVLGTAAAFARVLFDSPDEARGH